MLGSRSPRRLGRPTRSGIWPSDLADRAGSWRRSPRRAARCLSLGLGSPGLGSPGLPEPGWLGLGWLGPGLPRPSPRWLRTERPIVHLAAVPGLADLTELVAAGAK